MARTLPRVFFVKQIIEPTYAVPIDTFMSLLLSTLKFNNQLSTMLKIIIHITEKKAKPLFPFF